MLIQGKFTKSKGLNQTQKQSFATANLAINAAVTLTSTIDGDSRNADTFQLITAAAAENANDAVLVAFTGTEDAVVCTVTPDNGGSISSAQLVELINTGSVSGVVTTVTDLQGLRTLQTASGGDNNALAEGGNGSNVTATFKGALTSEFLLEDVGVSFDFEEVQGGEFLITPVASTLVAGQEGTLNGKRFSLDSGDGIVIFTIQNNNVAPAGPNVIDVGVQARSAVQVRNALETGINNHASFNAESDGGNVKVTCAKTGLTSQASLPSNGAETSGFTIAVTAEGRGNAGGQLNKTGITVISRNHEAACAMTLGSPKEAEAGTIKHVLQASTANGTGAHAITITDKVGTPPALFNAALEKSSFIWLGHKWAELIGAGGAEENTAG